MRNSVSNNFYLDPEDCPLVSVHPTTRSITIHHTQYNFDVTGEARGRNGVEFSIEFKSEHAPVLILAISALVPHMNRDTLESVRTDLYLLINRINALGGSECQEAPAVDLSK